MIRIGIADDHVLVRKALVQALSGMDDFSVVGEASDAAAVLDLCRRRDMDVLLLDLSMPGTEGTDLIHRVHKHQPALPILMLSMHSTGQIALRAIRAGASGYVTKGSEPEILFTAIRKVAGGRKFIDPSLTDEIVFAADEAKDDAPHASLSEREAQVLRLFVSGKSIQEIANLLSVSSKTVSTHKLRLMQKLQVDTNADLIRYALQHGFSD